MWLLNKLSIFRSAPQMEKITDPERIKKEYPYWRMRTFYSMYIGICIFLSF